MKKPFFSVVIPTLDEERYIGRLLTKLTKQTIKNFEVIVVDGKSHDATRTIVSRFSKRLPLTLLTTQVRNVSVQRNKGARKARGKYLIFFDADVQFMPTYLQQLQSYLDIHKSVYLTTYIKADSNNLYDQAIASFANLGTELSRVIEKPFTPGFNFIIKRSDFLKMGGFHRNVVHGEDYDLSIRLNESGYKLALIKKPKLTFSLRRFREEGRLTVIRKLAKSSYHQLTKGSITDELFDYPMGGGWYGKNGKRLKPKMRITIEQYLKDLKTVFIES